MRAQEPSAEEGFVSNLWLIMLLGRSLVQLLKSDLYWLLIAVFLCFMVVKSQAPDKAPAASGSSFNQLLGIKGAAQESVSLQCWVPLNSKLYLFFLVLKERKTLYSREPDKNHASIYLKRVFNLCATSEV